MRNGAYEPRMGPVTAEPVTVDDVKTYAKIDFDDEDDLLAGFITTARDMLERYLNISFFNRQVDVIIDNECGSQTLPMGPIKDDDKATIVVKDCDGNAISDAKISGLDYLSIEWPRQANMQLSYKGGFAVLPQTLKDALCEQVGYMWAFRNDKDGALEKIAPAAKSKCVRYRRVFNEFFL